MSRVINTQSPGKTRSQLMRTAAEIIRRLGEKESLDEETRDMAACLVYCFRGIEEGIEESVLAWEKRDYWIKAEQFRIKWAWVHSAAIRLEGAIRQDAWDELPMQLIPLLPHFEEIKISKYTRSSDTWAGAYARLVRELR